MYIYADRILIQVLAFSLSPFLGLITTAFGNLKLGILTTFLGFTFIFFQPYFSEQCLRNTAKELGLTSVVLAEGKVTYLGESNSYSGKLFLTKNELVFVLNNKIDFKIPLTLIDNIFIKKAEIAEINDLETFWEKSSPNLNQLATMVSFLVTEEGQLELRVKNDIFTNYYCFQVTAPLYWHQIILSLKKEIL